MPTLLPDVVAPEAHDRSYVHEFIGNMNWVLLSHHAKILHDGWLLKNHRSVNTVCCKKPAFCTVAMDCISA